MSSFARFATFIQCCELSGVEGVFCTAFGTSSASAPKSRAAPPIPNASTEAVPRINFLVIAISRSPQVVDHGDVSETVRPHIAFPWPGVTKFGQAATEFKEPRLPRPNCATTLLGTRTLTYRDEFFNRVRPMLCTSVHQHIT